MFLWMMVQSSVYSWGLTANVPTPQQSYCALFACLLRDLMWMVLTCSWPCHLSLGQQGEHFRLWGSWRWQLRKLVNEPSTGWFESTSALGSNKSRSRLQGFARWIFTVYLLHDNLYVLLHDNLYLLLHDNLYVLLRFHLYLLLHDHLCLLLHPHPTSHESLWIVYFTPLKYLNITPEPFQTYTKRPLDQLIRKNYLGYFYSAEILNGSKILLVAVFCRFIYRKVDCMLKIFDQGIQYKFTKVNKLKLIRMSFVSSLQA